MITRDVPYTYNGQTFTGYLADGSGGKPAPGVLVVHEAFGLTDHPKLRARMLAELGYVAFAMDQFGEAITSMEQAMGWVGRLMADPADLRARTEAALAVLRAQPNVDGKRIAAIGYCFGGTTVLELARSGADVACVVGFHSGLSTNSPAQPGGVKTKVLALIGETDPVIPPEQRAAFEAEMRASGADWQMHLYGGVGHSFTNRDVDARGMPGFKFDEAANRRSWAAMRAIFDETMGPAG